MDKRFIIFIAVSAVILYISNFLIINRTKNVVKNAVIEQNITENDQKTPEESQKEQKNDEFDQKITLAPEQGKRKILEVETDFLKIQADSRGARITRAIVKHYIKKDKIDEIDLIDENVAGKHFSLGGVIDNQEAGLETRNWDSRTEGNRILFTTEPADGIRVTKQLTMSEEDYTGKVEITLENNTQQDVTFKNVSINWGPGKNAEKSRFNVKQVVIFQDGKAKKIKNKKKDETTTLPLTTGWVSMKDQYFCAIFYNGQDDFKSVDARQNANQTLEFTLRLEDKVIRPQKSATYALQVYFGPQNYQDLKALDGQLNKIVNFGMFHAISVPFYYLLKFFYSVTKNYGFAIILLTILVRLILWWPTQKSYVSMKKMQAGMNKMQPRLKTLKEIYKDNPSKLNEETMKLYREYQINPMGGCLPMLLQMPVFLALYWTLNSAVELKGAEFIWFWKDLSAKDPVYVLPLLMGLSMFAQQKMSTPPAATSEAATQQKMMLYLMPAMLTFFAFMWPSGLLIYWVVSNILAIGQQMLINRKK